MNHPTRIALALIGILFCASASADQAACDQILAANRKTGSSNGKMKSSGYAFAGDTPDIYGPGTHSCSYLRDETVDGQTAAVYREQYRSQVGSTDALIWISKTSGQALREEQDGDIVGKGKGHISYRWSSATPGTSATSDTVARGSAVPAAQMNGKLPMYPGGRNMNSDMPASAIAMGVPMVLETTDAVHVVDGWYNSHTAKSCARSAASGGVKYACPAGSIMIYPHGGKTQIAFVPAMSSSMGGH